MIEKDIEKVLISKGEILAKSTELGKQLTGEYQGKSPLVVGILKGAIPFIADLTHEVSAYLELDFMDVSNYGNTTASSGRVKVVKDLNASVEDRHILIVEDIVNSGRTLAYLVDLFRYRKAVSAEVVTLLDKPEGRIVDIKAGYVGFDVPNEFVVGYELDYTGMYRNLPYIGVLEPEVYESSQYLSRN